MGKHHFPKTVVSVFSILAILAVSTIEFRIKMIHICSNVDKN